MRFDTVWKNINCLALFPTMPRLLGPITLMTTAITVLVACSL